LVDHLFRHQSGRMVAILTRIFGIHNFELAEDILQDTLHQALKDWSLGSIPDNPAGWLMVVAKRKAINTIKREKFYRSFAVDLDTLLKSEGTSAQTMDQVFLEDEIRDSQLRMIFTCCHPDLVMEAQVALTLKTLCGFGAAEIAAALLTTESNIHKRLYRAKEKIRSGSIDFTVPAGADLRDRLDAVLLIIYLLFNEGYNATGDNPAIRKDLCLEAMRLGMLLIEHPATGEYPPLYALMALLCLHSARFDARIDTNDAIVILDNATALHLEAAIAAEHCLAPDFASTDWKRIHHYYTALVQLKPSSVIHLNLAIATGKKDGPGAAITLLHKLEQHKALENYYLLYTALGEFYQQAGSADKALDYFRKAKELTRSPAIRQLLDRKMCR